MEVIIWKMKDLLLNEGKKIAKTPHCGYLQKEKCKSCMPHPIASKKHKVEENKMQEKQSAEEGETGEGCKCNSVPA